MLGTVVLALPFVAAAVILAVAASKPNILRVERTAAIRARPEEIFPLVNDFRKWSLWSPYDRLDPAMKKTYSEQSEGVGAVYEWSGNTQAGAGLETSPPWHVTIKLEFTRPFQANNIANFTFTSQGAVTQVVWATYGPQKFTGKVVGVLMNMDAVIGADFVIGLAKLKKLLESPGR